MAQKHGIPRKNYNYRYFLIKKFLQLQKIIASTLRFLKVQSLQDAVKYKYKFSFLKLYPKDTVRFVSEISNYLSDNRIYCKNLLECLDHVAYDR